MASGGTVAAAIALLLLALLLGASAKLVLAARRRDGASKTPGVALLAVRAVVYAAVLAVTLPALERSIDSTRAALRPLRDPVSFFDTALEPCEPAGEAINDTALCYCSEVPEPEDAWLQQHAGQSLQAFRTRWAGDYLDVYGSAGAWYKPRGPDDKELTALSRGLRVARARHCAAKIAAPAVSYPSCAAVFAASCACRLAFFQPDCQHCDVPDVYENNYLQDSELANPYAVRATLSERPRPWVRYWQARCTSHYDELLTKTEVLRGLYAFDVVFAFVFAFVPLLSHPTTAAVVGMAETAVDVVFMIATLVVNAQLDSLVGKGSVCTTADNPLLLVLPGCRFRASFTDDSFEDGVRDDARDVVNVVRAVAATEIVEDIFEFATFAAMLAAASKAARAGGGGGKA